MLVCFHSNGQEKMMQYNASATYHYGFLIAHRAGFEVLVKGYTSIGEFTFSKRYTGTNDWEQKYADPYFGTSFMIFDFGNPEQIGKGVSLFAFYNFPLTQSKNFELTFRLGFGPGYVEKVFDKKENYKNHAVSTHINGFVNGNLMARYTVKERYYLSVGLSFSHFSNAAAKKPNGGLNIPAANIGVGYRFNEREKIIRGEDYDYDYLKKWDHDIVVGFGRKSRSIESGEYAAFSIAYAASRHVSFKSRLGGGADLFYNSSHRGQEGSNGEELTSVSEVVQIGANISYTLQIDKLSIFINQGIYVYTKYDQDGLIYNRFGFRYLVFEKLILNLSMKTHFAVADHVEWGIGYRF